MPGQSPAGKLAAPHGPSGPGRQRDEDELDRHLDSGVTELPPNQVKGVLGERGLNVSKIDEHKPDLNSGISQEVDLPVIWAAIVLCLLTVLLSPVGYVLLWRSPLMSRRAKVIWTGVGAAWAVVVVVLARSR